MQNQNLKKNNLKYLLCRDFQFSFLFVDNIFVHGFLLACFSTNLDKQIQSLTP